MNPEFIPVNLLEHAFVKAAADPAARPVFFRELLDSKIFVVPVGEVPPVVNGFIQADTKITLANIEYNGHSCVAIFTSKARITPGTKFLIMDAKVFFEMTRGAYVFLNPGAAYGKEFVPDEIARMLNGAMFQPIEKYEVKKETRVIIGAPKDYPTELIEALSGLYKNTPEVERAWITFYHNPERDKEGCLLLCMDTNNPSIFDRLGERMRQEIHGALAEVKAGPQHAGHFLKTKTGIVKNFRRCNLRSFPFFILYGYTPDVLIFGSLIPSHSDPLTWLTRFEDFPTT